MLVGRFERDLGLQASPALFDRQPRLVGLEAERQIHLRRSPSYRDRRILGLDSCSSRASKPSCLVVIITSSNMRSGSSALINAPHLCHSKRCAPHSPRHRADSRSLDKFRIIINHQHLLRHCTSPSLGRIFLASYHGRSKRDLDFRECPCPTDPPPQSGDHPPCEPYMIGHLIVAGLAGYVSYRGLNAIGVKLASPRWPRRPTSGLASPPFSDPTAVLAGM